MQRRPWLRAALAGAWPGAWSGGLLAALGAHEVDAAVPLTGPVPGPGAARGGGAAPGLAAAWVDASGQPAVGLLQQGPDGALRVHSECQLPSRAHGLLRLPDGSLLVVARRPGDWLLRWRPGAERLWAWSVPERRFNGHAALGADGSLCTTETALDDGQGWVVQRDPQTLAARRQWPTHGIDPHQLLATADGGWWVANGGVPTQPETGRLKTGLESMDSSLLRLDAVGARRGQWRLADRRLSLRHLAWHPAGVLGIALQAEHEDAAQRANAPLLALFDGQRLRLAASPPPASTPAGGYGGDIVADADGFVVAATRGDRLMAWSAQGDWRGAQALAEAGALAIPQASGTPRAGPAGPAAAALWAGGRGQALQWTPGAEPEPAGLPGLRLDNHWVAWR